LPTEDGLESTDQYYPDEPDDVNEDVPNTSCWQFVLAGWFQVVTAVIIIANLVLMIVETANPSAKSSLAVVDQVLLCFYIFELISRTCFFRGRFLFGPLRAVVWNVLDVTIVAAGMIDSWLLPNFHIEEGPVQNCLQVLRCLRIVRVLKIIRIFLESDLSWTEDPKFQSFIGIVIVFNSLLMGMETDIEWGGWFFIEQILLTIYVFELAVRLRRFGLFFLSCNNPDIIWNALDFMIVVSSSIDSWLLPVLELILSSFLADSSEKSGKSGKKAMSFGQAMMLIRMMRLMRILRLVKLVKSIRPLYFLITSVLSALQGVAWVLVLTLVVLYSMGIVSTRLIGHGMLFSDPSQISEDILEPFSTVPDSMFTLFRVMSGAASDQEAHAIDDLMSKLPTLKFAFVFFLITSSWTLLSILTAVVSENMISTTGQQEYEMKLASDEEDRANHMHELRELFQSIDVSGDGLVQEDELVRFLAETDNAARCAKSCRVPVRDIRDVFRDLSLHGEQVDMHNFTECLVDVAKPVTEKSIMKLEARVLHLQKITEELILGTHYSPLPKPASEQIDVNEGHPLQEGRTRSHSLMNLYQKMQAHEELMLTQFHAQGRVTQQVLDHLKQLTKTVADLQQVTTDSSSQQPYTQNASTNAECALEADEEVDAGSQTCSHFNIPLVLPTPSPQSTPAHGSSSSQGANHCDDLAGCGLVQTMLERLQFPLADLVNSIAVELANSRLNANFTSIPHRAPESSHLSQNEPKKSDCPQNQAHVVDPEAQETSSAECCRNLDQNDASKLNRIRIPNFSRSAHSLPCRTLATRQFAYHEHCSTAR